MPDHEQNRRAISDLGDANGYHARLLEGLKSRTIRWAIADAVNADTGVSQFNKDGLQTLCSALGREVHYSDTNTDLRQKIASECHFNYDETSSTAFTKHQLAQIAMTLARRGKLAPTRTESVSSRFSFKSLVPHLLGFGLPIVGALLIMKRITPLTMTLYGDSVTIGFDPTFILIPLLGVVLTALLVAVSAEVSDVNGGALA